MRFQWSSQRILSPRTLELGVLAAILGALMSTNFVSRGRSLSLLLIAELQPGALQVNLLPENWSSGNVSSRV